MLCRLTCSLRSLSYLLYPYPYLSMQFTSFPGHIVFSSLSTFQFLLFFHYQFNLYLFSLLLVFFDLTALQVINLILAFFPPTVVRYFLKPPLNFIPLLCTHCSLRLKRTSLLLPPPILIRHLLCLRNFHSHILSLPSTSSPPFSASCICMLLCFLHD